MCKVCLYQGQAFKLYSQFRRAHRRKQTKISQQISDNMFECVHGSVPVRVSDQPQYQGWAMAEATIEANADHSKVYTL